MYVAGHTCTPCSNIALVYKKINQLVCELIIMTIITAPHTVQVHGLEPPTSVDMVFDCIRVMWVAMIVCILFFEMNLSNALWTGVIVGLGYNVFARLMWRSQLAMAQAHLTNAHPTLVMVGDGRGQHHGQLTVL